MLIIEFVRKLENGQNTIRYKNYENYGQLQWNYMDVDIQILNLLLQNFGIYNIDDNNTKKIDITYCNIPMKLYL